MRLGKERDRDGRGARAAGLGINSHDGPRVLAMELMAGNGGNQAVAAELPEGTTAGRPLGADYALRRETEQFEGMKW